jgi:mRNA-degrading endonuclease toxin of MazEF toxin-antitoxin module
MTYSAGKVLKVNLGDNKSGQVVGHEQAKERPCIVLRHFPQLNLLSVVPCTTTPVTNQHFFHVPLRAGQAALEENCNVLCHQVRTVSTDRIIREYGELDEETTYAIQITLLEALDLNQL